MMKVRLIPAFLLLAVQASCQVKVAVLTSKPHYLEGEPISVIVRVTNVGSDPLGYDYCDGHVELTIVGQQGLTPPKLWGCFVGGGSLAQAGMATPRALGFDPQGNLMLGRSGQTSTQIVILTKPPQSWMVIPLGESDHADSAHFDDQAEKLFSKSRMKPTYFLRPKELGKHVSATEELTY